MRNVLSQSYAGLNLGTFITRILLWMVAGLAISTVSAYVLTATGLMNSIGTMGVLVLFIAQLVLVYMLRIKEDRLGNKLHYLILYVFYTALTGVTFAAVAMTYTSTSIVNALISTTILFTVLAVYGLVTKTNFQKLSGVLMVALIAVILVSLVNVFLLQSSLLDLCLAIVTMVIFLFFTILDFQKMKDYHARYASQPDKLTGLSIALALEVYLDFVNLFLSILRIFGDRR